MKFYSMAACRTTLEKICSVFELCPKYCHLQTNVNACFHFQLQQCRGVCSEKEAIESYNKRVRKAIKSLGLQTENLVIKENGRTDEELGFVLILNGIYQGFGYINKNQEMSSLEDYLLHITPQKDNRDVQRILNAYLSKNKKNLTT
jgi:DNA polymerase-3 subunit epsilon